MAEAELCPNCGVRQSSYSESSGSSDVLYYVQIAFGGLLILAAIGSITEPEGSLVTAVATGIIFGLIGLLLLPPVRSRLDKKYPVTTFGWQQTVDETPISRTSEPCTNCHDDIEDGVRRVFRKDLVVFGFKLDSSIQGTNHYCGTCRNVDRMVSEGGVSIDDPDLTDTGR